MAFYEIQVGRTDGFRYIGIKPPLDDEIKSELRESFESRLSEHNLQSSGHAMLTGCGIQSPDQGDAFTEVGLMVMDTGANELTMELVGQAAGILTQKGHSVTFGDEIQQISFGRYLFGGRARIIG